MGMSLRKVVDFITDSMGPGIPAPEPYEAVVDRSLRKKARAIAENGEQHSYREAIGILMAFQLDAENERREAFFRIRRLEKHWIFRRATMLWIVGMGATLAFIIYQHFVEHGLPPILQWIEPLTQ